MSPPYPAGFIPEPFCPIDEVAKKLCDDLREEFAHYEEVTRAHDVEHIAYKQLWDRASGGWKVDFECDLDNAHGHGQVPKRLQDFVDAQMNEALIEWVRHNEPYPGATEDLEAIRNPPNLRSLYEYAADKLGKSKEQVDADIESQAWNWLYDLPDSAREQFHEVEREWLDGSYYYGLEVAYLMPTDAGSEFDRPMIEIATTFRPSGISPSTDIAKVNVEPEALGEGLREMLVTWAIRSFMEQ